MALSDEACKNLIDALQKLSLAVTAGDSTITSAVLDRLLHHAETVVIEGSSYRMKDRIEP